jgi:predicted nuclease of predicted toxin-antitoxin system
MKLLLDENVSHRLRPLLPGHEVFTVKFMGWRGVQNGKLLALAASNGFDALITLDAGIQYQQNVVSLPCSVVILTSPSGAIDHLKPLIPTLLKSLSAVAPHTLTIVE